MKSVFSPDLTKGGALVVKKFVILTNCKKLGKMIRKTDPLEAKKRLGAQLATERKKKGITRVFTAKTAGITATTLQSIETGGNAFSLTSTERVANVLGFVLEARYLLIPKGSLGNEGT